MNAEAPPPSFVDTNIWDYAIAGDDLRRSAVAQALVRGLVAVQALRCMDQIAAWPVVAPDHGAVRDAVELSTSASLSLWDALIVVAAARSGATRFYSEDMLNGQKILGVTIVDPFRETSGIV
jgi:predicted nucleic acid-binding protein